MLTRCCRKFGQSTEVPCHESIELLTTDRPEVSSISPPAAGGRAVRWWDDVIPRPNIRDA